MADGAALRERLGRTHLYLCTGLRPDLADFADAVLGAGVDAIQLREKGIEAAAELRALAVLRAACDRHGALLSVNDRADVAHAAGADVLHLGQGDLPVSAARALLGEDVLVGRSTHDPEQLAAALHEPGVDYVCAGPVWATPTKPGRPAAGLDLIRQAAAAQGTHRAATRPWFAIGGIDADTLDDVLAAGARRVVLVRAITDAADPAAATRALKARLLQAR